MKQITVLSGKGGTGKTTLVASLAALTKRIVVTDCDVDAPNLHLLLKPEVIQTQDFGGSNKAVIDEIKCIKCGKCEESCRFDAIKDVIVDLVLCESCGVCTYVCPVEAIRLKENLSGHAFISKIVYGLMSHARLNPGEENSGKLVTLVRQNARKIAEKEDYELILNDGPPGIGCPVIASISGVDAGLIVIEPTLSGIHDMERVLSLLKHFQVLPLVCINKYDIDQENTRRISEFCKSNSVEMVGKVPFDSLVTKAMVAGKSVVEYCSKSTVSKSIEELWKQTLEHLKKKS
ncbi:MAG: (4Fe-4S)-binding protein [Thermoproteota archaeon]|nr:(4Fe-4S)-binding protein [Thermoproteota archaeon]